MAGWGYLDDAYNSLGAYYDDAFEEEVIEHAYEGEVIDDVYDGEIVDDAYEEELIDHVYEGEIIDDDDEYEEEIIEDEYGGLHINHGVQHVGNHVGIVPAPEPSVNSLPLSSAKACPNWLLHAPGPNVSLVSEATGKLVGEACSDGDVVLVCSNGVELKAHAQVLALHSAVLRQRLHAGPAGEAPPATDRVAMSEENPMEAAALPGSQPPGSLGMESACPRLGNLRQLVVGESSMQWELLLAATHLPEPPLEMSDIECAYTLAHIAKQYGMKRVLKQIADCAIVGHSWRVASSEGQRGTGSHVAGGGGRSTVRAVAYFDKHHIDHPQHILQLLHLALNTGHAASRAVIIELISKHFRLLGDVFGEVNETTSGVPEILQAIGLSLVEALYVAVCRNDVREFLGSQGKVLPQLGKPQHSGNDAVGNCMHDDTAIAGNGDQDKAVAELRAMTADGDIVLRCKRDGRDVRAHVFVLRQYSGVLGDMLSDCGVVASASNPATVSVDDSSQQWLAALAVMYPLDDDGTCPLKLAPCVLELADKYNMTGVRKRVMDHWSAPKNVELFLKQGERLSNMRDALSLLSCYCMNGSFPAAVKLCDVLLADGRLDLFFPAMLVVPAGMVPPVLVPLAWRLVLQKLTQMADTVL